MKLIQSEDFPKRYRIRNASLFNNLFNTGRRSRFEALNIITVENDLGYPRLGISISKRHVPKAVDRNKLKRKFREFFRKKKNLIGAKDLLLTCGQLSREKIKRYKTEHLEYFFIKSHEL